MAITPLTGFKAFTFDGEKSTDYGVAILGEGVFNAPERDVEMITIPGRNGTFALDNGRFKNIEVTYPANLIASSEADFADALSDFRNMLCSKKGYVRLQDDYHPNEYRMAVYKEGLDVDEKVLRAGEFEITFDCKPQRWLTSGETETTVTSGGTVTNPTLFESGPLLAIKGYGTIGFNGYEIELDPKILGHIVLKNGESARVGLSATCSVSFSSNLLNAADTITLEASRISWRFDRTSGSSIRKTTVTSNSGITGSSAEASSGRSVMIHLPDLTFAKGTSLSYTNTTAISISRSGGTATAQLVLGVAYDGSGTITFSLTDTYSAADISRDTSTTVYYGDITGESTQSQLGNPTYIDCDLGDAYKIVSDEYVSLNANVELGSDLPKLASGSNTITYDNTITELKITPRWWKV